MKMTEVRISKQVRAEKFRTWLRRSEPFPRCERGTFMLTIKLEGYVFISGPVLHAEASDIDFI